MDYEPPLSIEHVQQADLTLAIPDIVFQELTQSLQKSKAYSSICLTRWRGPEWNAW
jgi:hypothetical protein